MHVQHLELGKTEDRHPKILAENKTPQEDPRRKDISRWATHLEKRGWDVREG